MLFFWENVTTVLEGCPAPVDTVREDMCSKGYVWECAKLDARDFLLRQRRGRVYGTADINSGQDQEVYAREMARTLESLKSDVLFPFEDIFDESLPEQPPHLQREKDKVQEAQQIGQMQFGSTNMFTDTSTSAARVAECAPEVVPCIRPTHPIYSQKLKRYVTVRELWTCQGMWAKDFASPEAVEEIWQRPKQAQDLCGNAFASTACQAKLIASLVHSAGWAALHERARLRKRRVENRADGKEPAQAPVMRRVRRKTSSAMLPPGLVAKDRVHEIVSRADEKQKKRKAKAMDPDVPDVPKPRKKYAGGQKIMRPGKHATVSIMQKMKLFKEFEALVKEGNHKFPEKFMVEQRRNVGQYRGCFAKSKWGGQREKQRWDLFVHHAPELARLNSEVPNVLRPVLGITTLKHIGSRYKQEGGLKAVPERLVHALRSLLAERIVAGEEVTVDYATNVLGHLIAEWNSTLQKLQADVREQLGWKVLQETDSQIGNGANADSAMKQAASSLNNKLKNMGLQEIDVKRTPKNLRRVAVRCCHSVGVRAHVLSKQSKHLDFQHPAMQRVRAYVDCAVQTKQVHPRLIGNFDQVWCLQYEPARSVLGVGSAPSNHLPAQAKMIASIRNALDLGDPAAPEKKAHQPAKAPVLNPQGQVQPVEYGRLARTTTTLSWSDGVLGRAFITAASGSIPAKVVEEINQELKGVLYVSTKHESGSHMWNSGTMADYLEFLGTELRGRRISLGLKVQEHKALILADKASVHSCATFAKLRERFEHQHNAILVAGVDLLGEVEIPGGWGACGAPNDGFHQHFHALRRAYMRAAVQQGGQPGLYVLLCTRSSQKSQEVADRNFFWPMAFFGHPWTFQMDKCIYNIYMCLCFCVG